MKNKWIFSKLTAKIDIHTIEVIRKSSAAMLVKIGGMTASLAISIILGRTIGPEGLGIINLSNKIVAIVAVFVTLGMDTVLLKEIAISYERKNLQNIANVIFTSFRINLPLALIFSVLLILSAPYISTHFFKETQLTIPLIIASVMIVPQMLSKIFASGVNGYRKIWQSGLVNNTLSAGVAVLGLLILIALKVEITVINVAILYALGRLTVTISIGSYWGKLFKFSGKRKMQTKSMLKVALPLFLVSTSLLVASSTDTIMLGWLRSAREVGIYNVAARLGLLTSLFLVVSISTLTPKIASLFAENKKAELQIMVQQVTKGMVFIGLCSLLFFFLAGKFILNFWGPEFTQAYWPLLIIAVGQFFNIATGSTGIILMMTGYEKTIGYITLLSAFINVLLNSILIPHYGVLGAAIATSTTVTTENLIKVIIVKVKTGILTIPYL